MPGYPPTINSKNESIFAGNVAKELVGSGNVITEIEPSMGGEDFSYFLNNNSRFVFIHRTKDENHKAHLHTTKYDFNDNLIAYRCEFLG